MIPVESSFALMSALGGALIAIGTLVAFRRHLTTIRLWFAAMNASVRHRYGCVLHPAQYGRTAAIARWPASAPCHTGCSSSHRVA